MRFLNKKADRIIVNKIVSEHERITIVPGKCRFNFRCHNNAVHEAIKREDEKIAMVIYIEDNCPVIHFVNYHKGKYIDNTLGNWASQYEFYFIRFLGKEDFWFVYNLFNSYRAQLRNCLPFWVRWFSNNAF